MPSCIGSPEIKTVGISLVAPLAASSEGDAPVVTITATRRRTRSAAISRSRSYRPSRPTVFDDDVLTLNVAGFIQAPMKRGDELCEGAGRLAVQESNHRHRGRGENRMEEMAAGTPLVSIAAIFARVDL